jgi:hypothetical protein
VLVVLVVLVLRHRGGVVKDFLSKGFLVFCFLTTTTGSYCSARWGCFSCVPRVVALLRVCVSLSKRTVVCAHACGRAARYAPFPPEFKCRLVGQTFFLAKRCAVFWNQNRYILHRACQCHATTPPRTHTLTARTSRHPLVPSLITLRWSDNPQIRQVRPIKSFIFLGSQLPPSKKTTTTTQTVRAKEEHTLTLRAPRTHPTARSGHG